MEKIDNEVCRHKKGTVNGICIECGIPININHVKYSPELKRILTKEEIVNGGCGVKQ